MFQLDDLDLNGYISATNQYEIRDEFEINESDRQFQWATGPRGAALVSEPDLPNVEIMLPMRIYGVDADDVAEAYGVLREKLDKVIAAAGLGGTDLTWTPKGATWDTTLKCFAGAMSARKYDHQHKDTSTADFTLTLIVGPYFMGPEYTLASGSKPTGLPAAEVLIADAKGDAPGPARVLITSVSVLTHRWAMLGVEHRNYRASTALVIKASSLTTSGYSGSLTAAANEVQLLTKTGTISGGLFYWGWGGFTAAGVAYNDNAATVQAGLEAMPGVGAGNVVVTGGPISSANFTVTFQGDLAGRNLPQLVVTSYLTGGGSVAMSTPTPGTAAYVRSTLYPEWTTLGELTGQLHVGTYRVVAVVRDNATAADLYKSCIRFRWGVGDLSSTVTGASVTPQGVGDVTHVSLGTVIIPEVETGTQNWGGFIEVKTNSATAGRTLDVQDLLLFPVELSFASTATPPVTDAGTISAFDAFGQAAGALNGKTANLGGNWATDGSTTDLAVSGSGTVTRSTTSDGTATYGSLGRSAILTAAHTDVSISIRAASSSNADGYTRLLARVINVNNWASLTYRRWTGTQATIEIVKSVGGSSAVIATVESLPYRSSLTLGFRVFASGLAVGSIDGVDVISVVIPLFATGGALATGASWGFTDSNLTATACARTYSNFKVSIPPAESAVQHPARGLTFGAGIIRESAAGGVWGPAPNQMQARPVMIGPAGPDGLSNRLLIATADQNPDLANSGAPDWFNWEIKHIPVFSFNRYVQ